MGIIDTIKSFLNGHDKEVDQLLGKAGDMAKTRFAGHDGQIDGLVGQARQHTGAGDTTTPAATGIPDPGAPRTDAPTAAPTAAAAPMAAPASAPVTAVEGEPTP